ncbi:hypothetical protein ZIOFF_067698 [Zingiber officinale]|uniref:Uncharacterized protein n=1 Tax=Zingiber officinale TaxID=94328 RepID=A0A8J5CG25_ZINOF|nr:hypothetical protein ZIOFF_067698 [Zingiber officinale]
MLPDLLGKRKNIFFHGFLSPPTLRFLSFFFLPFHSLSEDIATEFLYPNFYAAYINFSDNSGVFLSTSAYLVAFNKPSSSDSRYYVVVLHARSSVVVWTANPTTLMSSSSTLSLTGVRPRAILHQSLARLVDTVAYLSVNATRIYLLAGDQKTALFEMILRMLISFSSNAFHMAKLDSHHK